MILNISGTVAEIIAFAETRKHGTLTPKLTFDEAIMVENDSIILAIKSVRQRLNLGLKEAKDYVESTPQGIAYLARRA